MKRLQKKLRILENFTKNEDFCMGSQGFIIILRQTFRETWSFNANKSNESFSNLSYQNKVTLLFYTDFTCRETK